MAALTVVVADRGLGGDGATKAVREASAAALASELDATTDQVIWVSTTGLTPTSALPALVTVPAPDGASRGDCYRLGLTASCHRFVAFTDSTTTVEPGWRIATLAPLEAGARVVGGPVLPSQPRSRSSWAGFFVDYGAHAAPPYVSTSGDVSGNNVAYRREILPDGAGPLWKSEINARLASSGHRPRLSPGMRVVAHRQYRWSDLSGGRIPSGAQYGIQRSAGWGVGKRLIAALGCGALPGLALWRLWVRVGRQSELRAPFFASLPAVAVALAGWSAGEAWGYLWHGRSDHHVW